VPSAIARSSRQASMPFMRGMSMSRKTIAGSLARAASMASMPSPASRMSKPATSSSVVAMSRRMNGSSSTIRTERVRARPRCRRAAPRSARR
jgi:hypothetical protein